MKNIEDIYRSIIELEGKLEVNKIVCRSLNIWPLFRQTLWFQMIAENEELKVGVETFGRSKLAEVTTRSELYDTNVKVNEDARILFFSRSAYLVKTRTGDFIDRIVDPLIYSLNRRDLWDKYYFSDMRGNVGSAYRGFIFKPVKELSYFKMDSSLDEIIVEATSYLNLDFVTFKNSVWLNIRMLFRWFEAAKLLKLRYPRLEKVYLTSWYFPDCMGLIAALREEGIELIDVQHGKQGKFHPMYSGWTHAEANSKAYDLLPSTFWCWGQASVDNIVQTSKFSNPNKAIVGGLPWIEYFRSRYSNPKDCAVNVKRTVLFTLQRRFVLNPEPIPDFILEALSFLNENIHFIFKPHPNDRDAEEYIRSRLREVALDSYEIADPWGGVYDLFERSTHHLTSFSSTCYEALVFSVPTLLFGETSKRLYREEIEGGEFSWTSGSRQEFEDWLDFSGRPVAVNCAYLESSLSKAASLLTSGLKS